LKDGGGCYTAAVKIGSQKSGDLIVDTGSFDVVIESQLESSSATETNDEEEISYGSGDVLVKKVKDSIEIAGTTYSSKDMYVIEKTSADFPDIDGIFALPQGSEYFSSFSLCFSGGSGVLTIGGSGASISTSSQWDASFSMSVGGTSTGIRGSGYVDSGTTLLIAPVSDLESLFETMCSEWSECDSSSSNAAVSFIDKVNENCGSGLPDLDIEFSGTTVKLSSYVVKYDGECNAAFDYDNMWILGQPVFNNYNVQFDTVNKKIGFSKGCSSCGGSLDAEHENATLQGAAYSITGPPRRGSFNRPRPQLTEEQKTNLKLVELAKRIEAMWAKTAPRQ
jgi:hypothetical protein